MAMTDLDKLKMNLQEEQSPYFTAEQLNNLLEMHTDIWAASYYGCLMKAQNDATKLPGGLEVASNREYWLTLAGEYKSKIIIVVDSSSLSMGGRRFLPRIDGQ